jgi:hypothetical protein
MYLYEHSTSFASAHLCSMKVAFIAGYKTRTVLAASAAVMTGDQLASSIPVCCHLLMISSTACCAIAKSAALLLPDALR